MTLVLLYQLLFDIQNASKFIHIQYFIFRDDVLGRRVRDALVAAVDRGVEVRLLYDDMGSMTVNRRFFKNMELRGVEVRAFMRIFQIRPSWRLNYRNHRKIVVIDGKIAYTGGLNIADEYINKKRRFGHWKDAAIMIRGEAVKSFTAMFLKMWAMVPSLFL